MNQLIVFGKVKSVFNINKDSFVVTLTTKTNDDEDTNIQFCVNTEGKYDSKLLSEEIRLSEKLAVKLEFIIPTELNGHTSYIATNMSVVTLKETEVMN